jgi:lysophospholipase L1-like esterase
LLTPVRRGLLALYCLFWLIVIGGLAAEILLVVERRMARDVVLEHRQTNLFAPAREIAEGFEESLWEQAWKRYRPNAGRVVTLGDVTYRIRINSQGFRSAEFERRKPDGRFRVACIGGSTTVQGRTNETTYPAILEAMLKRSHPDADLEVLNLGISGTGSEQWVDRLDLLFDLEPDVVVQYNGINDIAWRHLGYYALKHPLRRGLNRSHVFQRLFPLDATALDDYFERTFRNYGVLAQRLARRGIGYVVGSFAVPHYEAAPPDFRRLLDADVEDRWGGSLRLKTYRQLEAAISRYNAAFERFADGANLDAVQIHGQLSDPALFIDSCHMTDEGIERLALAFLPAVSASLDERAGRPRR